MILNNKTKKLPTRMTASKAPVRHGNKIYRAHREDEEKRTRDLTH